MSGTTMIRVATNRDLPALALVAVFTVVACTVPSAGRPPSSPPSTATTTVTTASPCNDLTAAATGELGQDSPAEVSGLVLSSAQTIDEQPLIWIHNDSGTTPSVYATTPDGRSLTLFELSSSTSGIAEENLSGNDVEDIAIADGVIYLADIGDNNEQRDSIRIFAFDEPQLGGDTEITSATVSTLMYPDGPHDAEAFAIDPISNQILIVTKTVGIRIGSGRALGATTATIYSAPLSELDGEQPIQLSVAGQIDAASLDQRTDQRPAEGTARQFGLDGLITGMDITADGQLVALRTYGSVWLFPRLPDEAVSDALTQPGCEAPTVAEAMGEAVGFLPMTADQLNQGQKPRFFTIGEGANAPIHQTS